MKFLLQIGLVLMLLLGSTSAAFSQDRKIDKLSVQYEQQAYERLVKYADKLIEKKGYDEFPDPHLYKALALSFIANDERASERYPFAMRNSVWAYKDHLKLLQEQGGMKPNKEHAETLRKAWAEESKRLIAEEKINQAKYFTTHLAELFDDTSLQHLTEPEPVDDPEVGTPVTASVRDQMITEAENLIGTPYKYGGTTTKGFDCSGFTGYVSDKCGVQLPRTSSSQSTIGTKIETSDARKGDLVFFGQRKGKKYNITHVAMVVSEAGEPLKVIHSTSSKGVMISEVETSNYWRSRLLFAVNFVDE